MVVWHTLSCLPTPVRGYEEGLRATETGSISIHNPAGSPMNDIVVVCALTYQWSTQSRLLPSQQMSERPVLLLRRRELVCRVSISGLETHHSGRRFAFFCCSLPVLRG